MHGSLDLTQEIQIQMLGKVPSESLSLIGRSSVSLFDGVEKVSLLFYLFFFFLHRCLEE
jgi:hypothetical protein